MGGNELCYVCKKSFDGRSAAQDCGKCFKPVHKTKCARKLQSGPTENHFIYECKNCQDSEVSRPAGMLDVDSTSHLDNGTQAILAQMKLQDEKMNSKLDKQAEVLHDLKTGVEQIKSRLELVEEQADANTRRIHALETKNEALQKDLNRCMDTINHMNEYGRRNTLEIFGVPSVEDENLFEIIGDIGKVCNVSINKSNIDAIHRDPRKISNPIVVKFVQRELCNELKYKRQGKKILASQIGYDGDHSRIFLNVLLTKEKSYIAYKARLESKNLKIKENILTHVWVDDASKIWIKKSLPKEGNGAKTSSARYEIKTIEDISEAINKIKTE
ncbi:uncharacterized protein LOC127748777 [Frankliniella occidentalis]|uniref:Uncharacterized protein LOC127748777 n=1 Tax=Frankliniella occidentalis TaxID=133901 RepID=A0A9C6U0W5_FRAOC|nr:uncharacterized protein LOC127748777 [Frankliniella occidentalis]